MNVLVRALKAAWDEVNKPETFIKGDEFENFVRNNLFPVNKFELVQKTHDYTTNNNDYVESSKEPDFQFRSRKSGFEFFVEAKYRSGFYDGAIQWCKPYQFRRYKEIEKQTPVYIVIGVGRQPGNPQNIFLLPVRKTKYPRIFQSALKFYEIPKNRCVNEKSLV